MATEAKIANCEAWRPLGEAIKDYHLGEWNTQLKVISSAEHDVFVPMSSFYRQGMNFPKLEKNAFRLCRGKVLDAGAGAGSHSLHLIQKGLDVTALDISESSVDVMKMRGIKSAICADLYHYMPFEKFDTVLMMMNGIGIAGDLDGLRKLLAHLKELIKPDGQIIFDSSDISYVTEASRAASSIQAPKPDYFGTTYYQLGHKGLLGEMYTWLFIDPKTMDRFAREAGFKMHLEYQSEEHYLATLKIIA